MNKIKFYKNNIRQEIPTSDRLIFLEKELKLIKENDDTKLILDIGKNKCIYYLKKEDLTVNIPVVKMNYFNEKDAHVFSYILVSDPEVENLIKIAKKET